MGRKVSNVAVLLDANVLNGDLQRDLLLSLAEEGLYNPLWSERILDEVVKNLQKNLGIDFRRTRQNMKKAFPKVSVKKFDKLFKFYYIRYL